MEEDSCSTIFNAEITGIRFALASHIEITTASISDSPISHASQLGNPFLGLPLEFGKCDSCGTSEPGKCEGHFGYIELPIPIYHPCHISELRRMLSLLCLKCLKMKSTKFPNKKPGLAERLLSSCCEGAPHVSVREAKTSDGAIYLELKASSRSRDGFWSFLKPYGFSYGYGKTRTLLPYEVMQILKRLPGDTKRKLSSKGYFPQDGYVVQYVPVPPNCLSVPEISDGVTIMSTDPSITMLKKILRQVEIIKSSRSGDPNFESQEVEANDLQIAVDQYLQVRGTARASRDMDSGGVRKEPNYSSAKVWLEKMRTLFIRKGSGFSSRSVITGDAYTKVNEIGIPMEVAQRITFEEKVNDHNLNYLQDLVDKKLCLTFGDGSSTYSLKEGSKGHTFLRLGQVVHRRIMDGDIVFINRPPTTHKHSLQALRVYIHDDHTVKINPLICGPLSADFDGDCIHLFYPQSLPAKAEVLELFSVEKQLLSSHSGNLNLQLATDSVLSLKMMFRAYFFDKAATQQLAMFVSSSLPWPALFKAHSAGSHWTAWQILQTVLPARFDCLGEKYLIKKSDVLKVDTNRDVIPRLINEIVTSIFFERGPEEVLNFFNSLQALLMENIFSEGFSVGLDDFSMSMLAIENIQKNTQVISPLLYHLRSTYNELVELQLENHIQTVKGPIINFILMSSELGNLIDYKSDSAINKVVQQIGFLGQQLSSKRKFYTKTLIEDVASLFRCKYPSDGVDYPSAEYGFIKNCFFRGLDPYEEIVHSISTREVIVRSSRGLTEPGTLFKNLMAILRDVVVCYDGTVRNVCSNSIIQFEYGVGVEAGKNLYSLSPPGEPVGVLAATAMSNPAYKAVLDSTASSNSSWELMKEILLCKVSFKNDPVDRRVILYLNDCSCGRKYCCENAAYLVKNQLKTIRLKDAAVEFLIEFSAQGTWFESSEIEAGLIGHVHLNEMLLKDSKISMHEVLQKCREHIIPFRKKREIGRFFRRTVLSVSECCSFNHPHSVNKSGMPCLMFSLQNSDVYLEQTSHILADILCPVLLKAIIKGDPRISAANIIWVSPDSTSWIRNRCRSETGELALDVLVDKSVVKQSGDAWRIVLDSCLPVLHLIDTGRSIPLAIKQVQELLGISCAFDQAVQRLETSVTMVAKGVHKDHLILLANSMTCAGNLIGFNSGGYRALSRSLNIHVPFTEATLFTPRKCFERAAEKCHLDSLSSIVASCSWGKSVAVGTGSRFDVLWDRKEVMFEQEDGIDVYNFLHVVRSANADESNTGCLGEEIEDLVLDDESPDLTLSPDYVSSFDKPVFEDVAEFQNGLDNQPAESKWENVSTLNTNSLGGGEWGVDKSVGADWSNWGTKNPDKKDISSNSQEAISNSGGWNTTASHLSKAKDVNSFGDSEDKTGKSSAWSGWGTDKAEVQGHSSTKAQEHSSWSNGLKVKSIDETTTESENAWSSQGKNKVADVVSAKAKENTSRSDGCWDAVATSWKKAEKIDEFGSIRKDGVSSLDKGTDSYWDKKVSRKKDSQSTSGWGSSSIEDYSKDECRPQAPNHVDSFVNNHSKDKLRSPEVSQDWGSKHSYGPNKSQELSKGWTSQNESSQSAIPQESQISQGWESQKKSNNSWGNWNGSNQQESGKSQGALDWGSQNESTSPSWGSEIETNQFSQEKSQEVSQGFQRKSNSSHGWHSQNESSQQPSSHSWDSASAEVAKSTEWAKQSGEPFKKNQFEGSRGWGSNAGEWKNRKNRPPKSPGVGTDDSQISGLYTVTRQRLDMFTTEEQDALTDIEPIMQSIRRIMHQSGYSDGDPISADDQSYIIDNVFNHHPDKAAKVGAGIDHIMVSRHSNFQESRCFYIVSTDGRKEDFSYRKCLDNFIRNKYPDIAETFMPKYFRKPRPGGGRDRNQLPEETNENKNQEVNPTPDEHK